MQEWRDERGKEVDEGERNEFRDRLIYEFLFLNRAVFRDFSDMSRSGVHTYRHTRNKLTQETLSFCWPNP